MAETYALLETDKADVPEDEVRAFIETELKIKDKETGRIIPFKFNPIQEVYWDQKTNYDYILKYRKGGFSTLTMAEYFARAVLLPDQQVVFMAHRKESASIIFQTMHIFYQHLSDEWKEKVNGNRRSAQVQAKNELRFSKNGGQIIAMTGASPDAMRGLTPSMVHASELAFWKTEWAEESMSSIMGSIPPNGRMRIETTPSDVGSFAYQEWSNAVNGDSQFIPRFYTWWDDPTNRLDGVTWDEIGELGEQEGLLAEQYDLTAEQIAWRRQMQKRQRGKFVREYPEDAETCWMRAGSNVFSMDMVVKSFGGTAPQEEQYPGLTVYQAPEPGHSYVIGADPAGNAEDGDYSAAIAFDEDTGEEVFAFYDRLPIHDFASRLHTWGTRYNEACVSVERNNHGHAVIQYLVMNEPYPYLMTDHDDGFGIMTSPKSKAIMISNLDEFLWAETDLVLKSRELYREFASYVYDEHKKAGASSGHDDLVSATMVAIWTLQQLHPRDREQNRVSKRPQKVVTMKPPDPPNQIDMNEALKYSIAQMMMNSGLPFQNVRGSLFSESGLKHPDVGCPKCGILTSTLRNGFWACDGCGEVSLGALVQNG